MSYTKEKLRIVFLGTPEFAVASLQALIEHGYHVVGVVTAPDKPAGRGQKVQESEVKKYALSQNIPVAQPEKLRDPAFIATLKSWNADLQVVVAFRMLPEKVWNMPALGTINVHASLLPQYRGAAPINWAIINGEKITGVTTFLLQHVIDTGNILLQAPVEIADDDNIGTLYEKLKVAGSLLLIQTIDAYIKGDISPKPQEEHSNLKHAPKIYKEDGLINWENNSQKIANLIRGLSPIPGAYTFIKEKFFKIYKAAAVIKKHTETPGTIHTDHKTYLHFYTLDGYINCLYVQLEGKKKMDIGDFLRGYKFDNASA